MDSLFSKMAESDFEQVLFCFDEISDLKALIVIHDTTLGPAMGGVRMRPYLHEQEAVEDAFQLSRAMTLKSAAAGLNLGGGCAVILGDPKVNKSEALLRSFGRFVEGLGGRIIVAEDVGITVDDIEVVNWETQFVSGVGKSHGGSGNPALKAAFGVFRGIQACCSHVFGESNLRGRKIAVQGIGAVGFELARLLGEDGANLIVADKNPKKLEEIRRLFDVEVVSPDAILSLQCDVLAPCALGGIFTEENAGQVRAQIIAGAANNQLSSEKVGEIFHQKGITYAPDFVVNAGGFINAAEELQGYDETRANTKVSRIYHQISAILRMSQTRNIPTHQAANEKALERIRTIREVQRTFIAGGCPNSHDATEWQGFIDNHIRER